MTDWTMFRATTKGIGTSTYKGPRGAPFYGFRLEMVPSGHPRQPRLLSPIEYPHLLPNRSPAVQLFVENTNGYESILRIACIDRRSGQGCARW